LIGIFSYKIRSPNQWRHTDRIKEWLHVQTGFQCIGLERRSRIALIDPEIAT
jgi:hypothetical protein